VEDVATSHLGAEVTRTGLFRLLARLDRNGKGLLRAVEEALMAPWSGGESATRLGERIEKRVRPAVGKVRDALTSFFDALDPRVPDAEEEPLRLGRGDPRDPAEDPAILELLDALRASFGRLGREVAELRIGVEEDKTLTDMLAGRLLDLQSAERRIESTNRSLGLILDPERDKERFVRWIEGRGGSRGGTPNVLLAAAPVEPGELLEESLFRKVETTVVTSATLATGGGFGFMRERLGLARAENRGRRGPGGGPIGRAPDEEIAHELAFADIGVPILEEDLEEPLDVSEMLLASPFDYATQTLFCVPSDLPAHDSGLPFQEATARVVEDLAGMTGGGVFVLFTSHKALRTVAALLRAAGVDQRWPLLVHGEAPRHRLLTSFVSAGDGILLGTASFWEGVDVPGDPLRGLVLQKIPFRVPNEPITQARMEAIEARGERPFDTYQLPLAALRLKQGFGRLVRSREDRGGILLLDSRILSKSYGRALLRTLPAAPLVKGPWDEVKRRLAGFYGVRDP
jgi:ATP-dependent DNA helicase DinG